MMMQRSLLPQIFANQTSIRKVPFRDCENFAKVRFTALASYPQREEDGAAHEAEHCVLVADAGDVVEDVDVVVHDAGVGVALVVRVNGHPQQTLPLKLELII